MDDMLTVKDDEQIQTYQISYEGKATLTVKNFENQLRKVDEIPDISFYNNCNQYNLNESTADSRGYRLYVLDDQYWIGILYKDSVWRVVFLSHDN